MREPVSNETDPGYRVIGTKGCPRWGGGQLWFLTLDIFRIESGGVRWCEAAATVETANARIHRLGLSSPGNYFIFDRKTGERTPMTPQGASPQVEYTSVELYRMAGKL
jgi:hypothetical protein